MKACWMPKYDWFTRFLFALAGTPDFVDFVDLLMLNRSAFMVKALRRPLSAIDCNFTRDSQLISGSEASRVGLSSK